MRRTLSLALLFATSGCLSESDGQPFVAPLDGQTAVGRRAPLQVHLGDGQLPTEVVPPQDLIAVVDTETGGFVAGEVIHGDGTDLLFVPDERWASDHRYVWSVRRPLPMARQPELELPDFLLGEAVFSTSEAPELLEAVATDSGQLCLLFSAPLTGAEVLDELQVGEFVFEAPDWEPRAVQDEEDLPLLAVDRGVGGMCMTSVQAVAGRDVRLTLDGRGPWQVRVDERPLGELLLERHRSLP